MTEPTAAETNQAAQVYTNIANLIRNGFFPGQHAAHVKDALSFLDQMAAIAAGQSKPAEPLHAVPDETAANP